MEDFAGPLAVGVVAAGAIGVVAVVSGEQVAAAVEQRETLVERGGLVVVLVLEPAGELAVAVAVVAVAVAVEL